MKPYMETKYMKDKSQEALINILPVKPCFSSQGTTQEAQSFNKHNLKMHRKHPNCLAQFTYLSIIWLLTISLI